MKAIIDSMSDPAAWTASGGATITAADESWYCASGNARHLRAVLPPGSDVALDADVDVSSAEYLQLSLKGLPENNAALSVFDVPLRILFRGAPLENPEDPEIEVTYAALFYPGALPQVRFPNVFARLTGVKLFSVSDTEIVFRASDLIAFADEFPIDIYRALAEMYGALISEYGLNKLNAGKITAAAGATGAVLESPMWVDRLSTIEWNGERHVIEKMQMRGPTAIIEFNDYLDGKAVLADASGADVTVHFPVLIEPGEDRAIIGSVALDGAMNRAPDWSRAHAGRESCGFQPDGRANIADVPSSYLWDISVSADTRHGKDLELLSRAVALGYKRKLWINGRPHEIREQEPSASRDFGDATNILPGIITTVRVSAAPLPPPTETAHHGIYPSISITGDL